MPQVLELHGITKSWGERGVLRDLTLSLAPGDRASLVGVNGAGKTTLLRIAAGLIRSEGGTVRLCGLDPERERMRFAQQVGFLSAGNSGLYGRLRAEHHLELWTRLALMEPRARREAIQQAIAAFSLAPLLAQRTDRLSMGQRQRLRLALAFVHRPALVLLDEPLTSLDESGVAELQQAIDEHIAIGGAVLICLPSGWAEMLTANRRLELRDGRVEALA